MELLNNYKVGVYCRLSQDDGNVGESNSIITQKLMIEKYCLEHELNIYDFYVDDGYSGLNYNRPSFIRLLSDIEHGLINMVITKDLSRLGRDYIQTGHYTEVYFPSKHVRYIAINDNVDTLKEDNDIAPFKNILNDMYAKDLSKKVKLAKRSRAMNGMFIGAQTPYGYLRDPLDNNHLVIDTSVSSVIKDIFRLALMGHGSVYIAKELERRKISNPRTYKASLGDTRFERFNGNPYKWCYTTIRHILQDIVYIGDMENRKVETENYKTKKRVRVPKENHIIVNNTHEAIITRSDFEIVQNLIKSRITPHHHNHENLFRGILYCKQCGKRMNLAIKERYGRKEVIYKCMNHFRNKEECKYFNSIFYDNLKEIVTNRLKDLFSKFKDDETISKIIKDKLEQNNSSKSEESEKKRLENRLNEIYKVTKKLYEDYSLNLLPIENYQNYLNDYEKEKELIKSRLTQIEENKNNTAEYLSNFTKLKEVINEYIDFKDLNQEMLYKLVDRIEINHPIKVDNKKTQEIKIVWRFINNLGF